MRLSGVAASPELSEESGSALGRILVVDDDEALCSTTARLLGLSGFTATQAAGGAEALTLISQQEFDVVLSDISMPGMDGIRLLREIRRKDPHVQVILMTGVPSVETAISALDYGAMKYLTKPMSLEELRTAVQRAVRLSRIARAESRASIIAGKGHAQASDLAGLEVVLDRTLETLFIAYQPIVEGGTGRTVGFEALVRSADPSLPHPNAVLEAAELLGRLPQLGQLIRSKVAAPFTSAGGDSLLFVNLHPTDLLDPTLGAEGTELRSMASRVVLEITERASLHRIPNAGARVAALRKAGFRIAVDDLGAGYAGLSSFTHLEPDFVKLDVSLIRGIDGSTTQRRVVGAITSLAKDLGMIVVAEGIETIEECDTIRSLGCDLLQGFLFAMPAPALPKAKWPYPAGSGGGNE